MTVLLIAANAVVFFLFQPGTACEEAAFVFRWAAIPEELLTLDALDQGELSQFLGRECAATVGAKNVLLSAISAMFLHGDLVHLGGNMLFLWVFGNNVEDDLGHLRYLGFYLGGGVVATLAFVLFNVGSPVPLIGASGAVAAVLGAYLILHPRAQVRAILPFPLYLVTFLIPSARITFWLLFFSIALVPAWLLLGFWFVLQLQSAANPIAMTESGVAYVAHVAGFVAGIVGVVLLRRR